MTVQDFMDSLKTVIQEQLAAAQPSSVVIEGQVTDPLLIDVSVKVRVRDSSDDRKPDYISPLRLTRGELLEVLGWAHATGAEYGGDPISQHDQEKDCQDVLDSFLAEKEEKAP